MNPQPPVTNILFAQNSGEGLVLFESSQVNGIYFAVDIILWLIKSIIRVLTRFTHRRFLIALEGFLRRH
jgi:hypothetical protein